MTRRRQHRRTAPTPWFVEVALPGDASNVGPRRFALGPVFSWSGARELVERWERENGPGTTGLHEHAPPGMAP